MKGFAHKLGQNIGINVFITKIMVPSAFTNLFEFHNPIFTKHSTMTLQWPVELIFLHSYLSKIAQEQEPIVFRNR